MLHIFIDFSVITRIKAGLFSFSYNLLNGAYSDIKKPFKKQFLFSSKIFKKPAQIPGMSRVLGGHSFVSQTKNTHVFHVLCAAKQGSKNLNAPAGKTKKKCQSN